MEFLVVFIIINMKRSWRKRNRGRWNDETQASYLKVNLDFSNQLQKYVK